VLGLYYQLPDQEGVIDFDMLREISYTKGKKCNCTGWLQLPSCRLVKCHTGMWTRD